MQYTISKCFIGIVLTLNLCACQLSNETGQSIKNAEQQDLVNSISSIQ